MNFLLKKLQTGLPALRQAAELVYKSSGKWTLLTALMALLQGLFPLLSLYLIKLVVDAAAAGVNAADKTAAFQKLLIFIFLAAAAGVIGSLLNSLAQIVQEYRDLRVNEYISNLIHTKSVQVDLAYYENPAYFDTLHMAQHQAAFRPVAMVNKLVQMVQNAITLGAMVAVLLTFNALVLILAAVAVIPAVWVKYKFSRRLYEWHKQWTPSERKSHYYGWLISSQEYAKELRLYGLGDLFTSRFKELHWRVAMERLKINRKRAMAEMAGQFFTILVAFALLAFIARGALTGAITLGGLVMYYQAFQRGQTSLQSTLKGLAELYEDSLFLRTLFDFLHLEPAIADPPAPRTLPKKAHYGIGFERVLFQYPSSAAPALREVSFQIAPGEHIALVGENGSGKSTLIKLICRLYDPQSGRITLDGFDLRDYAVADLRKSMSVLLQDFSQYHTTARENIWYGDTTLPMQEDAIQRAAQLSGAASVIEKLPQGMETPLGRWIEEGSELSTGEWQRMALARAFYREAPIVILDEPTASLDADAEYRIHESFLQLAKEKTALFISHKLFSARAADRILVLDQGRLVEEGDHAQLMQRNGQYARLYSLQAQRFA